MPTLIEGFIKGETGVDAHDGLSRATAKKTVANLISTYAPTGGFIFLEEKINEAISNALFTSMLIQPTSGGTLFDWNATTALTFVLSAGSVYVASVGAGLTISAVCDSWDATIDGSGRHGGYMVQRGGVIIGNTVAAASVVNVAAHGLTSGDTVVISGSNSTPTINGSRVVTVIDADHFSVPVVVTIAGTAGNCYQSSTLLAESWTYDTVGGNLYIRRWDSSDPTQVSPQPITFSNAAFGAMLNLTNSAGNNIVDGGGTSRFTRSLNNNTNFAVTLAGGGNIIRDATSIDVELHDFIFYGDGNIGNVMQDLTAMGGGSTDDKSAFTWYGGNTDVVGGRALRLTGHLYSLLKHAGTPIAAKRIGGIKLHTFNGTSKVTDWEGDRCRMICYDGQSSGTVYDFSHGAAAPANGFSYPSFPIRLRRSTLENGYANGLTTNCAFWQCFFHQPRQLSACMALAGVQAGGASNLTKVLFDSCVFLWSGENFPDQSLFTVAKGCEIILLNCTFINYRVSTTSFREIFTVADDAAFVADTAGYMIRAYGTLFHFNDTGGLGRNRFMVGNATHRSGNLDLVGNWYNGIDGTYGDNASTDTKAHFQANADPTGTYDVNPQLANYADTNYLTAGKPLAGGALTTTKLSASIAHHSTLGYNGQPYNRTAGAWQGGGGSGSQAGAAMAMMGMGVSPLDLP
jgi:hypothetical protein